MVLKIPCFLNEPKSTRMSSVTTIVESGAMETVELNDLTTHPSSAFAVGAEPIITQAVAIPERARPATTVRSLISGWMLLRLLWLHAHDDQARDLLVSPPARPRGRPAARGRDGSGSSPGPYSRGAGSVPASPTRVISTAL